MTNLPAHVMGPSEVLAKYHALWHVEQSSRMSKTDLRDRPIFHRRRDAIEAHLTVVRIAGHLHTGTDPLSIDAADILTRLEAESN